MRVQILSGSQTGSVVDLPQTEAENAVATGYAKRVDEDLVEEEAEPSPAVPPKLADKLSDSNVAQATELVAKAKDAEQLDVLEKAELAGKNRKGVLDAIEKRRGELKG